MLDGTGGLSGGKLGGGSCRLGGGDGLDAKCGMG